eukprot:scaffold13617_cov112-Isochrysis_galbana.AAC.2
MRARHAVHRHTPRTTYSTQVHELAHVLALPRATANQDRGSKSVPPRVLVVRLPTPPPPLSHATRPATAQILSSPRPSSETLMAWLETPFFFLAPIIFSCSLPLVDSLVYFADGSGATRAAGCALKSMPMGRGTRVPPWESASSSTGASNRAWRERGERWGGERLKTREGGRVQVAGWNVGTSCAELAQPFETWRSDATFRRSAPLPTCPLTHTHAPHVRRGGRGGGGGGGRVEWRCGWELACVRRTSTDASSSVAERPSSWGTSAAEYAMDEPKIGRFHFSTSALACFRLGWVSRWCSE